MSDEDIPQDPGIPGFDTIADDHTPIPDPKDPEAERRERPDDPDEEGHMTAGEQAGDQGPGSSGV